MNSHVEMLWAARHAEQDEANAERLARWRSRLHRNAVSVPERAQVVFLANQAVEPIHKIRSVK